MTFHSPEHEPRPRPAGNVFSRHWRGELPLNISFWVMGLPVALLQLALTILIEINEEIARAPVRAAIFVLASLVIAVCGNIWQNVGIWRSAGRSMRLHGPSFWPRRARAVVCLGAAGLIVNITITGFTLGPALVASIRDQPAWAPSGARILRGGAEIEITGPFRWSLVAQVRDALEKAPQARVVHLNSEGGELGTALEIRDMIRRQEMETYVATACYSACTLAFLAGQRRWVLGDTAQLGFHQPRLGDQTSTAAMFRLRYLYRKLGLKDDFIDQALATPADKMWRPARDVLRKNGVVTDTAAFGRFAVSGFGPAPTPAIVGARLRQLPVLDALALFSPDDFAAVQHDWFVAVSQGGPGTVARQTMNKRVTEVFRRALLSAPDASIVEFGKFTVALLHALRRRPAEQCAAAFLAVGYGSEQTPPELREWQEKLVTAVLSGAFTDPMPFASPEAATRALVMYSQLEASFTVDGLRRSEIRRLRTADARLCAVEAGLRERIVKLTVEQAAGVLRVMYTPADAWRGGLPP